MKFLFIPVLLLFTLISHTCRDDNALKVINANQTDGNTQKAATVQTNSSISSSDIKIGQGVGLVTKINLKIGSVELQHEEIKGMMPAMIMEFYVTDKKELEILKIGDKVSFTLEDNKGAEQITKISKVE